MKPASFQSSKNEQNGNSAENGNGSTALVNNPFLKCEKDEVEVANAESKNNEPEKDPARDTNNLFKTAKPNLLANVTSLSDNSTFVFGQNLHERVVMVKPTRLSLKTSFSASILFRKTSTLQLPTKVKSPKRKKKRISSQARRRERKHLRKRIPMKRIRWRFLRKTRPLKRKTPNRCRPTTT